MATNLIIIINKGNDADTDGSDGGDDIKNKYQMKLLPALPVLIY